MKACLDILELKFNSMEGLYTELQNYYPEYEFKYQHIEKGLHKYTWEGYLVIYYCGENYKVSYTGLGNGGWLEDIDYQIVSIKPTQCKMGLGGEWV